MFHWRAVFFFICENKATHSEINNRSGQQPNRTKRKKNCYKFIVAPSSHCCCYWMQNRASKHKALAECMCCGYCWMRSPGTSIIIHISEGANAKSGAGAELNWIYLFLICDHHHHRKQQFVCVFLLLQSLFGLAHIAAPSTIRHCVHPNFYILLLFLNDYFAISMK